MAIEFKKLSEVEQIETASDNATVLVEEGGEIKRVPKKEVGGAGIKTAIIKDSNYDNMLAGLQTAASGPITTWTCINMTFEEAYQTMASGEPLNVFGMFVLDAPMNLSGISVLAGNVFPVPCIVFMFQIPDFTLELYWTADGLSRTAPSSGEN